MDSIQTIIAKINSLPIQFQTPDNLGEAELMQEMNELQKQMFCQTMNKVRKSKIVAFSFCIFLGVLGGHRYYIGDYAIGAVWTIIALIIQNISESLIFIPVMAALVDFLWILDRIKEHNRDKSLQVAAQVKNSENPFLTPAIEKALKYAEIENFEEAIRELKNVLAMPGSEIKAGEIKQKLTEYQNKLDKNIFRQAVEHVTKNNFAKAISSLKQIAPTSENYQEAQQKITDYQNAFGDYLFQQAQEMASQSRFDKALESLKIIPEGTQAYQQVQEKIAEYEDLIKQQALEREKVIKQQALEREKAEKARQEQLAIEQEKIEQQQRMVEREKEELISKLQNIISVRYEEKLVAAVLLDKTLYLVDSVKRTRVIPSLLNNTYADGEFLIITLLVRNEGKKSRTISASLMTLVDSEEREFNTSSEGGTALNFSGNETAEFLLSEIQPGLEKMISIVFDIPPNAKDLKLKVSSGLFGKSALLPLSLALGEL